MQRVIEKQGRFDWLLKERSPWRLLRADNSPLILAFLGELFDTVSEVPVDQARTELELHLAKAGTTELDPATQARIYLNQWVDDGWLREQSQRFLLTTVTQIALQFVGGFESQDLSVSASHLETVNQEMARLLVDLSPDIAERQAMIDEQIAALERTRQQLLAGRMTELSAPQRRERVRHLYTLTSRLSQDFRRLEEEMRLHEIAIRRRILDDEENSGVVLAGVLDAEDLMRQSPAGMAFDGFYRLLGDVDRSTAFRSQIKRLMTLGIAEHLSADESRHFVDLISQLLMQSERVILRRRAATQSLRTFLLSGALDEQRSVDRLLKKIDRLAIAMVSQPDIDWHGTLLPIDLDTGKAHLRSPTALKMTFPPGDSEQGPAEDAPSGSALDADALTQMSGLRIAQVANQVRDVLRRSGPQSIGSLSALRPIRGGVEEVIALVRVAHATDATPIEGKFEVIFFTDERGKLMRAEVPSLILNADSFPDRLDAVDL